MEIIIFWFKLNWDLFPWAELKKRNMASEIWVNIGSGNGMLPDGTKPLPEPMLTDHQWSQLTFILGQLTRDASTINH